MTPPRAREAFAGPCNKYEHYFDVYDRHLARFQGRERVVLLEIGVQRGFSIEPWRRFFGPGLDYHGMDVDPACRGFARDGVTIHIGDQEDPASLAALRAAMPRPDIVLDDGGHRARQQVASFEALYPWLAEDGVYLVEDVHTAFWRGFQRGFLWRGRPYRHGFLGYAAGLGRRLTEWHWDIRQRHRHLLPREAREGRQDVSAFCRSTFAMTWHDSVVAFEKRPMPEPLRWEA